MRKQSQMSKTIDELVDKVKRLEAQVEIARLQEREACAKLFDANEDLLFWGSAAAKAIRGRTE